MPPGWKKSLMVDNEQQNDSANKSSKKDQGSLRWMSAGLEFCGAIAATTFIGYKIDQYFERGPEYTLAGFFLGFIGMVYIFYKDSKKEQ
jgi:F0F1-type ATP synthase assembly protein I